jgi:hypothetical protein
LTNWKPKEDFTDNDRILCLSPRIQEGAALGTEINLRSDQRRLIDYWAQAWQTAVVGISAVHDNQQIEYWLQIQVQSIAGEPVEAYLTQLKAQWLDELNVMTPMIAQYFQKQNIDYVFPMPYQPNALQMWFARRDHVIEGMVPLADAPVPKDGWISPDAEVVSYPPIPNELSEFHANLLFSGVAQMWT